MQPCIEPLNLYKFKLETYNVYILYIHRRLRIVKSVKLGVATLLILFHANIKIVKLSLFIYEKNKKQTFLLRISCLHESTDNPRTTMAPLTIN